MTSLLNVQNINSTTNTIPVKPESNTLNSKVQNNDEDKKQTNNVVFKGLVALSSIVVAGLAVKKGLEIKDTLKNSKAIYNWINNQLRLGNNNFAFSDAVKTKADEVIRIGNPQKRFNAIKKLKTQNESLIQIQKFKEGNSGLPKTMKELPAEVEQLWNEGKYLEAADVFAEEVNKLPTFEILPNAGKTVAETIEKTFGKNAAIQPHTYDLTKEADGMKIAFNDGGGYIYTTVGKNNKVFVERRKIDDYIGGAIENVKEINHATNILPENLENLRETYKKMGLELRDGYVNGRRVVSFSICPRKNPKTLMMRHFWLKTASNDGNLTPMQRDLWKLMEHPDKIDPEIFHKIAEFEYGKGFVNANYDLILSAIQTMAKGL